MLRKVRDAIADALVAIAGWLYGMTDKERREMDDVIRQLEEEAEAAPLRSQVPLARERVGPAGGCQVIAVVNGRTVRVRIPAGTTWVDGGSC